MFSETKLESLLGGIVFDIYYFPSWIKGLYAVFGSLALLSNSVCLVYIYKKLNLSNAVNLIPLLECVNNIIGFCIIGVISLIAFVDLSFGNLTCRVNIPVLGMMFMCSKSLIIYTECWQQWYARYINTEINFRSRDCLLFVSNAIHHCEERCWLHLCQMVKIVICPRFVNYNFVIFWSIVVCWRISWHFCSWSKFMDL